MMDAPNERLRLRKAKSLLDLMLSLQNHGYLNLFLMYVGLYIM